MGGYDIIDNMITKNTQNKQKAKSITKFQKFLYLLLAVVGFIISLGAVVAFTVEYINFVGYLCGIIFGAGLTSAGQCVYLAGGYSYRYLPVFIIGGCLLFVLFFLALTPFVAMIF